MNDHNDPPQSATSRHQSDILRLVHARGSCTVTELAEALAVSDETVRRHLKPLADRGLVVKVHGGVMRPEPLEEPPFQRRMQVNAEAKRRIAARVAGLIGNGDALILDTGSTTLYVAQALTAHQGLMVVTNSAEIARTLATRNGNRVFMAGGELRADDAAAFGSEAQNFVRQFQVRFAVLSMGAIHAELGFMDYHLCEAEFSRAAMGQAEQVIVAADSSKFGRRGFVNVCNPDRVDMLVCEQAPPPDLAERLGASQVRVQVAD